MKIEVSKLEPFEISRGFHARVFHSEKMTIAFVSVDAGSPLPEHSHVHEQVTNVLEGEFEMNIGGEVCILRAGESVIIPSNVPHSGQAISACKIMDVFQPVREDFKALRAAYGVR